MLPSKIVLLAAGLAGVLASTTVRAEEIRDVEERHAMYLDAAGHMHMITLNDKGHSMMMRHAHPLPSNAMIYRAGGKWYLLEDRKMAGGEMLFQEMSSWTNDRLLVGHN